MEKSSAEILKEHIANSPLVQAAIVEAVHRYYFDNILSDRKNAKAVTFAGAVLSNLFNTLPSWRKIIHKASLRYEPKEREKAIYTTSLPLFSKPQIPIKTELNIDFVLPITIEPND